MLTTEDDDAEFEDGLETEFEDELEAAEFDDELEVEFGVGLEAEFEDAGGFSMMRTADTCAARASMGSFGSDMLTGKGLCF